jgi:hypothetical protein
MEISNPKTSTGASANSREWLDSVIERTCRDFGRHVTREHILDVVRDVAAQYRDAQVTAYLPILVSRFTRERLQRELGKDGVK